jgi:hypothetical protein
MGRAADGFIVPTILHATNFSGARIYNPTKFSPESNVRARVETVALTLNSRNAGFLNKQVHVSNR